MSSFVRRRVVAVVWMATSLLISAGVVPNASAVDGALTVYGCESWNASGGCSRCMSYTVWTGRDGSFQIYQNLANDSACQYETGTFSDNPSP